MMAHPPMDFSSLLIHGDRAVHRRGIGRAILLDLIARARVARYHALVALCCSESSASIALHESLGFWRGGGLREVGRNFERWLDVTYLQLLL